MQNISQDLCMSILCLMFQKIGKQFSDLLPEPTSFSQMQLQESRKHTYQFLIVCTFKRSRNLRNPRHSLEGHDLRALLTEVRFCLLIHARVPNVVHFLSHRFAWKISFYNYFDMVRIPTFFCIQ